MADRESEGRGSGGGEDDGRGFPSGEEHWRSLFDSSPDTVFTMSLDGTITSVNRPGPGIHRDQLVGQTIFALAVAADRGPLRALLERVRSTGRAEIWEGEWLDPGQLVAHWESRFLPVSRAGEVVSFLVVSRDVTARREADEALSASEQRYRLLIENSIDAICLFDAQGIIRYANAATRRILDYEPGSLSGKSGWELIHPDDHAAAAVAQARMIQRPGQPVELTRYRLRHRDGSWRWVETVGTNLLDVPGVRAIVGNYRDITARLRLEEQLRQAQKMEAIGLLAGGVAHDFNNLLTVIAGFTEGAEQKLAPEHPALEDLAQVRQAAATAAQLTHKLLTFARRQVRLNAVFDLGEALRGFGALLTRIVGEDIVVEIELPSDDLPVEGDVAQLQQVLLNLCTNARQAMPEGGRLRLRLHHQAGSGEGGPRAVLEVTDSGTGMSPETRSRIFEPFFTTRVGGTGLGMSVVFGVVQDHHGTINLQSVPGQGTTVRVELPLHPGASEVEPPHGAAPAGGSETLLLAEDEPAVRALVARVLRRLGYTVLTASDGEEAIRTFAEAAPRIDLAIIDVIMPRLNGEQAFARMAALRPGLRVLFTSGYAPEGTGIAALVASGRAAFLAKPFVASELAAQVRTLLDAPRPVVGAGSG